LHRRNQRSYIRAMPPTIPATPATTVTRSSRDPLDFSTSVDLVFRDAAEIRDNLTFRFQDGNQLWFILPDGVLPAHPEIDVSVPYLRFTAQGRRDCMLTRLIFMRNQGAVEDLASGLSLRLEFRPCTLVGRTSEGRSYSRRGDPLKPDQGPEGTTGAAPGPAAGGTEVPDIGALLAGLEQTRASLGTIDTLLQTPDALLVEDDRQRHQLQQTLSTTRDQVLIGLGQVGELLSRRTDQPLEEWRLDLSKAISDTIEAMVTFEDMSPLVREEKRRELEALKNSIQSYFGSIDPETDYAACRRFSSGVNKLLLEDRRQTLAHKQANLTRSLSRSYDGIISTLQHLMPKGVELPLIPFPHVEPVAGAQGLVVLNMIHLVLALRFGGLSIRLETENHPRLGSLLTVGDGTTPPRLHIIDRRRFALLGTRRAAQLVL